MQSESSSFLDSEFLVGNVSRHESDQIAAGKAAAAAAAFSKSRSWLDATETAVCLVTTRDRRRSWRVVSADWSFVLRWIATSRAVSITLCYNFNHRMTSDSF